MSLDSQTLFDRGQASLDESQLVARLTERMPPELEVVVELYRHTWRPQEWSICESRVPGTQEHSVCGPGGFIVKFHPKVVAVFHMLSFYRTFMLGGESRDQLRAAYFSLGGFFDASELLYTHELAAWTGETLDEAACSLRDRFGEPARSLDALSQGDEWGPGGWFRERIRAHDEGSSAL